MSAGAVGGLAHGGPEGSALRQVDVAIVGAGPAGVTLANLLGQRGLAVAVFERDAAIYPMPRAIHFDGEVMRVFETAGLRAEVEAVSRPGLKGMHFVNAAGQTLMVRAGTAERGPHGCANNHYFHQPELEAVLRAGLARFPQVSLLTQHDVTGVDVLADGGARLQVQPLQASVGLQVQPLQASVGQQVQPLQAGTSPQPQAWHARWVVGCDGARSLVRRLLGTRLLDLGLHQPWLVFDVRLNGSVPGLPDHTVQHCDPARPMTYCNVTGNRRRWEIMLMPGDDPAEMVKPERIWPLVARWLQPGQAQIERAVIYTFHAVIAQGWRRGPLLLAGDAAHQTPPFLGQGMCAAIRDVANLAWKLHAHLRGRAHADLLDTYEAERSPHVHAFIDLAVKLGAVIQATDPEAARERDARFTAGAPEVFEFPAPRLGPGVWAAGPAPVAQVFPQPTLADGRGLDAAIGQRLALLATPEVLAGLATPTRRWCEWHGVALLPATDPEVQAWLQHHAAAAVLLRPDRYIAGLAHDAAAVDCLLQALPGLSAPPDLTH